MGVASPNLTRPGPTWPILCATLHTHISCVPTLLPADYGDPNLQQLILLLPKDEVMRKITQVR